MIWLWQLPQIILGYMILLILYPRITRTEYHRDVTVYRYQPGKRLIWGISLGPIIILADHPYHDITVKNHEYGHSIQSRLLGPLYLLVVGIPSLCNAMWWKLNSLPFKDYYKRYPEKWADTLGGVER